ncbi:hypothetical protein HDE_10606 [Halotydeus destructor]|nr:hypothetical protein HDE_10606 [Halotydeus destructor]
MNQLARLICLWALIEITVGQVTTDDPESIPWVECAPNTLQQREDGSDVTCIGVDRSGLNKCKSSEICDILLMVKVTDGSDSKKAIDMSTYVRHPSTAARYRVAYISLSNSKFIDYDKTTNEPLNTIYFEVVSIATGPKDATACYSDASNQIINLVKSGYDVEVNKGPEVNESGILYETAKYKISPILSISTQGGDTVKPTLNLLELVYVHFTIRKTREDIFLQSSSQGLTFTRHFVPTTTTKTTKTTTRTTKRPPSSSPPTTTTVTMATAKKSSNFMVFVVVILALLATILVTVFLKIRNLNPSMVDQESVPRQPAVQKYFKKPASKESLVSNVSMKPMTEQAANESSD